MFNYIFWFEFDWMFIIIVNKDGVIFFNKVRYICFIIKEV